MGKGKYVVIVNFLIDKEGKVRDVSFEKSCEWSADAEVFRVFKNAPAWIPAQQNGKAVIYRQKQALTFTVSE
jgi:protein TonB